MLALQKLQQGSKKCTVNVLPCRIHHNGPAKVTKRYWTPATEKDGSKTSFFRGRKLRGKAVRLPAGYTGAIVQTTERILSPPSKESGLAQAEEVSDDEVQVIDDIPEPVKVLEAAADFKEVVVWAHDQLPDENDGFVKSVEEWLAFADAIHRP